MSEREDSSESHPCPRCKGDMIQGFLSDSLETIHVESLRSLHCSAVQPWICPEGGHISLEAEQIDNLMYRHAIDVESEA